MISDNRRIVQKSSDVVKRPIIDHYGSAEIRTQQSIHRVIRMRGLLLLVLLLVVCEGEALPDHQIGGLLLRCQIAVMDVLWHVPLR